jgi:hypothetical protein
MMLARVAGRRDFIEKVQGEKATTVVAQFGVGRPREFTSERTVGLLHHRTHQTKWANKDVFPAAVCGLHGSSGGMQSDICAKSATTGNHP